MRMAWNKVDNQTGKNLVTWDGLCVKIILLPKGTFWRHDQAGDLPPKGRDRESISGPMVRKLTVANRGRLGFTYTHKDPFHGDNAAIISEANRNGFTISLSANNPTQADLYADLNIGPVVVTVPHDHPKVSYTPAGRKVIVCPKQTMPSLNCNTCRLCARVNHPIIAFRAHGNSAGRLSMKLRVM